MLTVQPDRRGTKDTDDWIDTDHDTRPHVDRAAGITTLQQAIELFETHYPHDDIKPSAKTWLTANLPGARTDPGPPHRSESSTESCGHIGADDGGCRCRRRLSTRRCSDV
jgi:hypothetical protein